MSTPLTASSVAVAVVVGVMVWVVVMSGTDPPRGRDALEQHQQAVEDKGEDDDSDRPDDGGLGGAGATEARQAVEDEGAKAGALHVRGHGGDAHAHLRRDADAG